LRSREISGYSVFPLDVPLLAPFTTATAVPAKVQNFAVNIRLADGTQGWGETPTLPPITTETPATAQAILEQTLAALTGRDATQWRRIALELHDRLPEYAAVRAGIEMALIDAFARSHDLPLRNLFGGYADEIVTDITIPICAISAARALAHDYRCAGFTTLKIKIGLDLDADSERLLAIHEAFPTARLILDANAGYTDTEILRLLHELRRMNIQPALLEQPVPRADWDGLARLVREAGIPIAADESCREPEDVVRIHQHQAAHVVNIKLAKSGVVKAMQIAATAQACGLGLMIGGMVETRLAMGFAAHFAAGVGGFDWIDLDTPLLLRGDPIQGGCRIDGSRYRIDAQQPGHGASVRTTTTSNEQF
jgi:L-alanine-DL-glutamate epimerase-like enolase superfamily enzyme